MLRIETDQHGNIWTIDEKEGDMKIELYSRKLPLSRRQWRWRARHGNGRIMATSGESYANSTDCLQAIRTLRGLFPKAEVVEL